MVLIVCWYEFICFTIVLASIVVSLWILFRSERGCLQSDDTVHESLLELHRSKSLSSARLWTSCWRRLHPGWLLFTRSISFVSMVALLAWDIMKWDASIFLYYTEWTFILVIFYFAMGIVASIYGCSEYSKELTLENGGNEVEDKVRDNFRPILSVYGLFMQIIYQTSAGGVVLTDFVFWLIIVPFLSNTNTHFGLDTLIICMHTANACFLILETILNSLAFPWFRMCYFVLWSCLYVVFQWIIHACGFNWWPYPFLELHKPWSPLWYLCMAIVHIPCYGAFAAIVKAKNSCFSYLFPNAFVKA